jgi:hypothetical protein
MKKVFEITDRELITEVMNTAEYGVLALCGERPYAVPVIFVYLDDTVYFHSSPKGKKMSILKENNRVSFNVTAEVTIIPSYFSGTENLACSASAFFKSITIDGEAEMVDNREELARVFSAMMEKYQPEGRYKSFASSDYDQQLVAVAVVKIVPRRISAKFKFGQNLSPERFERVIDHLKRRGRKIDLLTINTMKQLYSK